MGVKLMVEILDHAPAEWTSSERLLALAIAEHANDTTRLGWPGMDLLALRIGAEDEKSVSRLLRQLSAKGYELRVALGSKKDGGFLFAARGRRSVYRLPKLCPNGTHSTFTCLERVAVSPPFEGDEAAERVAVSPPIPEQRVAVSPPFNGERVASGSSKGGHIATPSPQYPSKSYPSDGKIGNERHEGRTGWSKIDEAKENLEKIPEPLRTIVASLAETNPDATRGEALEVLQMIAKQAADAGNRIMSPKYYAKIAETGGFGLALANVRAQRSVVDDKAVADAATAVKAELQRLRETEPDCPHGAAAGASAHPGTGEPLCPMCRLGIAAPEPEPDEPLDDAGLVTEAYRIAWFEAGHEPIEMTTLRTIESQAKVSLVNGFDRDFLTEVARLAAPKRDDLFRTARKLAMEAAA